MAQAAAESIITSAAHARATPAADAHAAPAADDREYLAADDTTHSNSDGHTFPDSEGRLDLAEDDEALGCCANDDELLQLAMAVSASTTEATNTLPERRVAHRMLDGEDDPAFVF